MALLNGKASTRSAIGALALLAAAQAGCFSPRQPACAFSCAAPPHSCPASYTCGDDSFCHRNDGTGACLLDVDASPETAAAGDGALDAGSAEPMDL